MANSRRLFLEIQNAHLSYGGRPVLEDLSLSLWQGEVLGVLGPIGAGKTRILRLISGLETANQGQVVFAPEQSAQRVGYVFQNDSLIPWLSVAENLELCLRAGQISAQQIRELQIESLLSLRPHQMSGGMRKKAAFARGFLNRDPLVLMDEPFTGLDPAQKRALLRYFFKLREQMQSTIVFVSHDIAEALLICNRIALLSARERRIVEVLDNTPRSEMDESRSWQDPVYISRYQKISAFFDQEIASHAHF